MQKTELNHWNFTLNGGESYQVDLPYDFSIIQNRTPYSKGGAANGWYPGGNGEYTKIFSVEKKSGTYLLQIEGSYGFTEVFINGNLVAQHPHGYTEFFAELTPYVVEGENRLIIQVANDLMPNTRWYSGSGLYRRVSLLTAESGYIHPWGVYIKTATESAAFNVQTVDCEEFEVKVSDGERLLFKERGKSGESLLFEFSEAKKWSPENPYLYTAEISAVTDGKITDTVTQKFGFRTITLDPKRGFLLNGRPTVLRGGCVHHDNGILGANAYIEAEWRKVKLLKEYGFNAVRCSHNPCSRDFLDACDALGLLVVEEAFDMWRCKKNHYDYHLFFADHWKEDSFAMVMRDRSRASVVMWSIGNEIAERDGKSGGVKLADEIASYFRTLDDRPLTNALCAINAGGAASEEFKKVLEKAMRGEIKSFEDIPSHLREDFAGLRNGGNFHEKTKDFVASLDVVGYNYLDTLYGEMTEKFPVRLAMTTEAFSEDMLKDKETEEKIPQVIGHFVWTAIDYIGESGIGRVVYSEEGGNGGDNYGFKAAEYPYHLATCGEIGLTGEMRPAGAYRKVMYGQKEPSIWTLSPEKSRRKIFRSKWGWISDARRIWNYTEGEKVKIEVYSNADEVELFINGTSVGKRKPCNLIANFETEYRGGIVRAVNYRAGKAAESDEIISAEGVACIFTEKLPAVSSVPDLTYYRVRAVDSKGNTVPVQTQVEVISDGFIACGNDDPENSDNYSKPLLHLYEGKGLIAVRYGRPLEIKKSEQEQV